MADYDDDYGYGQEDEIEYNYDDYIPDEDNNDGGLNFEDMFLEAESANNIDGFKQLIELEKDNSSSCQW